MHEYYKNKRDKLKKTMRGFLALVSNRIGKYASKAYSEVFEAIWGIYERDMLSRFPYIGGDDASGTKNLTEAYMLVAMGEYLKEYGLSAAAVITAF